MSIPNTIADVHPIAPDDDKQNLMRLLLLAFKIMSEYD
jgi:hypothetical protein